ncbi:MAG: asparagine--tRNA ligase [Clostridia bacterium]|nr:asparagine--tRNA ligase [Clostridia bacterium]
MLIKVIELLEQSQKYMGQTVQIAGRIRTVREMKGIAFAEVWDGSCLSGVQVVAQGDLVAQTAKASTGAVVLVTGTVQPSPAAGQAVEVAAETFEVTGPCDATYPLQKKRHTLEYLRTIGHLRPRTNTLYAVFRVRSVLSQAIHAFFASKGFVYVHTPLITGSDCEGAGEMFRVTTLDLNDVPRTEDGAVDYTQDFFGKEAHLTVSGQLNVEAFALTYGNCYTFGPTFRAENSNTGRHASEFWMVEPEMAYCDLADNMQMATEMIKFCIREVLEKCPQEMAFFDRFIQKGVIERLENVVNSEFAHVTYTDAIDLLLKSGQTFNYPVFWGCDLATEHERYLAETIFRRPVFVTDYPKEIKAFYMRRNEDGRTVAAMDLLVPGVGEVIGGSQREERYDVLLDVIRECGLNPDDYAWYLDLRKYGTIMHSGFGLGLERILMYITGMQNIRDVLPFPRTPGTAEY